MTTSAKLFVAGGIIGLAALVQPWVTVSYTYTTGPTVNSKLWLWDLPSWNQWIRVVLTGSTLDQIAHALQADIIAILLGAALVLVGSLVSLLRSVGPIPGTVTLIGAVVSTAGVALAHASATTPGSAVAIVFSPDIGNVGAYFAGASGLVGYVLQRREGKDPGGASAISKAS